MTKPKFHADTLFAPLDPDLHLERIAGGNETEVYCTDDQRYVVKVKHEEGGTLEQAMVDAQMMRAATNAFAKAIGEEHSIPSFYYIAENNEGKVQPVIVQPYIREAKPLFDIDYGELNWRERHRVATQLRQIILLSLQMYNQYNRMPDIYGRSSHSKDDREKKNAPGRLPARLWSFVVVRNLLRSHNLLCTDDENRLLLIDYDPVRKGPVYQFVYYNMRRLLFVRDWVLIGFMELFGRVPRAER